MTELIQLIFICSLWCLGFNYATLYTPLMGQVNDGEGIKELYPVDDKKEILWFIRYYTRNLPKCITKPLYGCLMCMGSLHGSLFYWAYILNTPGRINGLTIVLWVVVITAVSGMNRLLKGMSSL